MLHHGVVRWALAVSMGTAITIALFLMMTRLVDGSWILERLVRVVPLTTTASVDPCEVWETQQTLVPIDGIVGYQSPDGFVPLVDAEIVGEHRAAHGQRVDVSPEGGFRFVTGFSNERPPACSEPTAGGAVIKRLIIRAPGCVSREVPVVRSWIPHRVLLECDSRV